MSIRYSCERQEIIIVYPRREDRKCASENEKVGSGQLEFGLVAGVLFALVGLLSRCRTGRAGALQAALDDRKQQSSRKKLDCTAHDSEAPSTWEEVFYGTKSPIRRRRNKETICLVYDVRKVSESKPETSWGAAGPNLPSCVRDDIAQRRGT